jgi:citrate lyase subunit beta/citryl-CoA lyase/(S)-citramalyl-CoA lyase
MRPHASLLYTPALRWETVAEPGRVQADMLVLDLEDSIHPDRKPEARAMLLQADLRRSGLAALGVRVNSIATRHGLEDMRLLIDQDGLIGGVPLDVVLIPKIAGPDDVRVYRSLLSLLSRPPRVFSFVETLDAVENAFAIAEVSDGLCFGQADLLAELHTDNEFYLDHARARLCAAASRHRRPAVDTNSFELHDMELLRAQCRRSREHGFTGKAAIHPRQLEPIREAFEVGPEELERLRRLVADYDDTPYGFAVEQDRVLAPPFVLRARRLLDLYAHQ